MGEKYANLFKAAEHGNLEDVGAFIKAGADIHARDKEFNETPLIKAVAFNHDPKVTELLLSVGSDVHFKVHKNRTPLCAAAINGTNPEVIVPLIKAGADIEARDSDGNTPLLLAAKQNIGPEMAVALIEAGADVNVRNNENQSLLDVAEYNCERNAKDAIIAAIAAAH